MATATGVGFSVNFSFNDPNNQAQQQVKPKPVPMPEKKYHDVFYVTEKKDYSYGTSPNALKSYSPDGKGSPNRSPKL